MPIIERIHALQRLLFTYIRKLNVYTAAIDDLPAVREDQIRATRVYLILLLLAMIVLTGYTALMRHTVIVEVNNQSQIQYELLQSLYPNTISCPCSQFIISVGTFVTINTTFHQVCLVRPIWTEIFQPKFFSASE
jgi:hypothetical protein